MTLKEKLKREGINIAWLTERLGLSRPTLDKYIDNPDEFRVKHLRKIIGYIRTTEKEALNNYFKKSEK
jgi:predicted transcriptional regulator